MTAVAEIQVPQAVGMTAALSAAGYSAGEVHEWFNRPRAELGRLDGEDGWLTWLTPKLALALGVPGAAERVLELARQDAAAREALLPADWEGTC